MFLDYFSLCISKTQHLRFVLGNEIFSVLQCGVTIIGVERRGEASN